MDACWVNHLQSSEDTAPHRSRKTKGQPHGVHYLWSSTAAKDYAVRLAAKLVLGERNLHDTRAPQIFGFRSENSMPNVWLSSSIFWQYRDFLPLFFISCKRTTRISMGNLDVADFTFP
ncbi:hypothetical protein I7I50_09542 [Histoplasma capsulatum G186AR]|uniref:Uncharacterized protein n=1 Tax=Ajellomyces capsulatus TaxID=5037 RepID=A0A8H8D0G9_AJECA|nr:hypothetical protein I7I52_07063 [Histoplasma capsulatum]QSS74400.1 hypothetical protein I7I50_09542 [Histoplasma capsulatum G186AR]